jgi:hypothetical protein
MTAKTKGDQALQLQPYDEEPDLQISDLIPLAESFLENQKQATANQLKLAQMQLEAQKELNTKNFQFGQELHKFERLRFIHYYWLIVGLTIIVLTFAAGLIFLVGDTKTGLLVLTHAVAIGTSFAAGMGIEAKRRKGNTNK